MTPDAMPSESDRRTAIERYNSDLRHRYSLRAVRDREADRIDWGGGAEVDVVRLPDGLAATVARYVVRSTPRFGAGVFDAADVLILTGPARNAWAKRTATRHALVSNPMGGLDNLEEAFRAFKAAADAGHRSDIVALALREVPGEREEVQIDADAAVGTEAIRERASDAHLAQVAYVFDVGLSTLGDWKHKYRGHLSVPRGRPKKAGRRP